MCGSEMGGTAGIRTRQPLPLAPAPVCAGGRAPTPVAAGGSGEGGDGCGELGKGGEPSDQSEVAELGWKAPREIGGGVRAAVPTEDEARRRGQLLLRTPVEAMPTSTAAGEVTEPAAPWLAEEANGGSAIAVAEVPKSAEPDETVEQADSSSALAAAAAAEGDGGAPALDADEAATTASASAARAAEGGAAAGRKETQRDAEAPDARRGGAATAAAAVPVSGGSLSARGSAVEAGRESGRSGGGDGESGGGTGGGCCQT